MYAACRWNSYPTGVSAVFLTEVCVPLGSQVLEQTSPPGLSCNTLRAPVWGLGNPASQQSEDRLKHSRWGP